MFKKTALFWNEGIPYENYRDGDDDDVGEDIDDVDDDDDVGDEIDDVDDDDDGRAGGNQELAARPSAKKPFSTILSFLLRAIHTLPSISFILKIMVLQLKLMRYLIRFFDKKSLEIVLGDLRDKLMRTSVGAEFCPFQRKWFSGAFFYYRQFFPISKSLKLFHLFLPSHVL